MFDRILKSVFSAAFVIMLLVPLLCTNLKPNAVSEIENRSLANFPELYDQEGNKNDNYISEFEVWFNDNIGLREQMFSMNSIIQYDIFNHSSNDKVEIGTDGWLFYTDENNTKIASGEYPNFGEEELRDICNKQIEIQKGLAAQGIEYVLFFPPSKVSVYPEYLRGDFEVRQTPADILADYLEENSDIKVIRIKPALLAEKEQTDDLLYFKTDTHWNAYGAYVAYKEIIEALNKWGIIDTEPVDVDFVRDSSMRDLTAMMLKDNEKYYENSTLNYEIINPTATIIQEGDTYSAIQMYVSGSSAKRGNYYENINKELPSFVVFGDSMFMEWMEPLMAENCSALTCIWDYDITQEMINIVKPDVVFYEMTERELNFMGEFNSYFSNSVHIEGDRLDITYCDFGQYKKMWFPVWSDENGQDDIAWYQAERTDEWTWHVSVDLNKHHTNGLYNIHFYQGETVQEEANYVSGKTYDVGLLFE